MSVPMKEEIVNIIDDYLIENGKGRIHISRASKLLREAGLIGSTAELKKMLESGLFPDSYQTADTPRQWYFIISRNRLKDKNLNPETLEVKCDSCGYAPIFPDKFNRSGQFIVCPDCKNKIRNPLYGRKKESKEGLDPMILFEHLYQMRENAMANDSQYGSVYGQYQNRRTPDEHEGWWASLSATAKVIISSIAISILIVAIDLGSGNSTIFESGLTQSKAESKVKSYMRHDYLFDSDSYDPVSWTDLREKSDGTYYITHTYRAKNGFGGYVQKTNIFHLDSEGNVLDIY